MQEASVAFCSISEHNGRAGPLGTGGPGTVRGIQRTFPPVFGIPDHVPEPRPSLRIRTSLLLGSSHDEATALHSPGPLHHGKRGPLWTPPSLITLRGVNTTWQSPASPLPVRIVPPCSPKACIIAPVVAHFPGDLPAFTGNHACPPSKQDLPTRGCEGQSQTLLTSCSARSLLEPSRQSGFPDEQAPRKD